MLFKNKLNQWPSNNRSVSNPNYLTKTIYKHESNLKFIHHKTPFTIYQFSKLKYKHLVYNNFYIQIFLTINTYYFHTFKNLNLLIKGKYLAGRPNKDKNYRKIISML